MGTNLNEMSDLARSRIAPEHRKELGVLTRAEIDAKIDLECERELQDDIRSLLNQRDIVYINPPMNRKSSLPEGWADFSFVYEKVPLAFECKVQGRQQTTEQKSMEVKMVQNGWNYYVIRNLAEVRAILTAIKVSRQPDHEPSKEAA